MFFDPCVVPIQAGFPPLHVASNNFLPNIPLQEHHTMLKIFNGLHIPSSFPFPLKITCGFILATPSANIVSCAVHCRLSRPDFFLTHTVEELYVGPRQKEKGIEWGLVKVGYLMMPKLFLLRVECFESPCETLVLLLAYL